MAIRYKALTELYQETQRSVTAPDQWRAFLASACRNYRLSFDEQLLVYAQRPDATAVLEIERWNRQFGRWVNRGANGIAVFDGEHNGKSRLKYYFDISDTHEARFPRPVPLWTVREEYAPDIIETLENSFGELENKENLGEALLSAAKNAVEDNMPDYFSELKTLTKGSFLEELDELNLEVEYRRAVENSIGYMLLVRCGLDPSDYFEDDDFRDVLNFNTPQTLNALGVATGDISQMCLSAISRTVLALQRQPQKENRTFEPQQKNQYAVTEQENTQPERSFEYDRDHLHQAGRLQSAEPSAAPGGAGSLWEIRIASEEVPQGAPQGDVHEPVDQRQAERPSGGDPAERPAPDGGNRGADGQEPGRDGGTEGQRPDEMGADDEQPAERGGGNRAGGTDLQLTTQEPEPEESAGGEQLPALLDEKQIMAIIANKDDDLKYKKNQIELFFSVHSDVQERAEYLKSAYQDRYTEIIADGQRLGYKPQENGLLMWEGSYPSRTKESVFSWDIVAQWIAQLIDKKEYFIQTDIPSLPDQESQQMSLFDFAAFQQPAQAEGTAQPSIFPHPALPQQVIDEALCIGANDQNSRLIICAYFKKDKPDNAQFLAEHYGENGAGFYLDGRQYAIWYNAEGIRIAQGESAQRSSATLISWEQAAARIRELLDLGRYMPQSELDRVDGYERQQRAAQLWYLRQDFAEGTADAGFLPTVNAIYNTHQGFPEESAAIQGLLNHPEALQTIRDELEQFVQAYGENRELLRFHFHRPQRLLEQLSDLQREPLHFTAAEGDDPQRRFFISGDEIDNLLRGGKRSTDYRLAVYSFYRNHTERKERETFLKHYHGEYSGYTGGNDSVTYQLSKGVSFSHGDLTRPYAKVELKWNAVEKRVSAMIVQGRFLTDEDRAAMPQYEKHQLARNIRTFFENVPQEQPHPYPFGFDYWDAVKLIEPQLDDPARVEEIYQMMVPIWEATPQDDRMYALRQQAFENLTAFRQGTFTLFAEYKEPVAPAVPQAKAYDLGYGHLGNGLTVWNRLEEEHGDYKTVAHIAPDRTVTIYDEEMPQAVREEIQWIADTSEMTISATQDAPVFAVPPRVQGPPQKEELADPYPELAAQVLRFVGEFDGSRMGYGEDDAQAVENIAQQLHDPVQREEIRRLLQSFLDHADPEEEIAVDITLCMEQIAELPLALSPEQAQIAEIAGYLEEAGYAVSSELVEEGLMDYRAHGGKGDSQDVADFIERGFLSEEPEPASLEIAKEFINDFCVAEYGNPANFSDLEKVGIAYTTVTDEEIPIQVNADLVHYRIERYLDGQFLERRQYESLDELIQNELAELDFDDLISVSDAELESISATPEQRSDDYRLLSRLKADCDYFLGAGGRAEKHLWAGNGREQIAKMRELYDALPEKPEWLTMEDIERYAQRMEPPYEVVVYHHFENGFDERLDYQTLAEAEQAAQKYVAGNMEGEDGFAYDGAGIYDLQENRWLRVYGNFPDERAMEQAKQAPATEEPSASSEQADLQPQKEESLPPPPKRPRRERITFTTLHPEVPRDQRHDFHITDDALGHGTPSEKYAANVAAIRTLKQIEAEERLATPEEQEILSRYVGWGGLADCFEETSPHYGELKSLLDSEEYAAARASTLTAFYTPPVVIRGIYKALAQMGFTQGNILEPSCGTGNFLGLLPTDMAGSKAYGVELDSISGRIAGQLYQNASISVNGFETVQMPDSFFDVAVGNVPFGDFKVLDKKYDKHHWLIHDYFFGKTLDKVRPGGIVAFITSKGTMDKENSAVRKYLAQRADLIGAIRLPDNTFKQNAGTEVTSDIIFLQKRDHITDLDQDWVHLDTDGIPPLGEMSRSDKRGAAPAKGNGIRMNRYFVQHPEMILGDMVMESTRFGPDSACKAREGEDLSEQLANAIQFLQAEIKPYELEELDEEEDRSIPADPSVKNFSYTVVDGQVYYRENSLMHPVEVSVTAENRIRGMIELRECVRRLIEYQTEGYPDEDIAAEQQKLNALYDSFTAKYGLLNSRGNKLAFSEDSSYCLLCSLEVLDEQGSLKRKADMFSKRTIRPHVAVTSVDTASEALAVSISEKARVDIEYMAELSGKSSEELEKELTGVIYRDIRCAENPEDILPSLADLDRYPFVTADEYLSGKVRHKLRMAKAFLEVAPDNQKETARRNVEALEAVQPQDLGAGEIGVRIGANWVPIEVYQQFMVELLTPNYYVRDRIKILRSEATGQWSIREKNADRSNVKANTTYGTKRMSAYHILEQTLNQRDVRVFDYIEDENGKKKPVLNKKETAIAQDRQELIKQKFAEWIWKNIDRRELLCRIYNETFNGVRPREYDGRHIRFEGMNPEISLRPHQINAIAHILYGGNTLLAHEVGAGKTYEMVAAAMEMKRLGLCTKSLIVVPNHITEQWAAEWLQLYPSANILVATKKDFETQNRKKFCSRIATGDYDAIIIGHSQFEKIPMSVERQQAILERQIEEILEGIEQAKAQKAERYTVKQMERTRKSLETRLAKLNDQSRKDDVVTFEQLGVDRLFIDESHYFKNLFLATKMRNVGGIAQTEAQKSSDLFMKTQYLDELTGGRGTIFATGTPISNSMVELYTIQRYLQYRLLQEMGLVHFDDWAGSFGETITAIELSPEGTGYRAKTRFAKFYNLPELMAAFKEVADIQTADMLKLPVPKANFHTEVIQPSELQKEMIQGLAERAEKIRAGGVDPHVDNMLRITNDGRKLALDMRLINPLAADDPNGKVAVCARNVYRIWEQTKEKRSAQLVFCDLSTPTTDGSFSVYDDLKKKLMDAGIPEEEIAFIHTADSEAKKKELFSKVRAGQVRVLLGSTAKMGAGTNVQDKLIALHDLDCPWRPSDLQQRLGRIVRQGNENEEVEIYRYVTEGTFDAYLYQLVENKQKFIAQIMTSKAPVRVADDVDETALSYSEIKALATGNPLIIEKCNLDMEVARLNMLKASHLNQVYALEELVYRKYPEEITRLTERIAGYEQDVALAAAHPKPQEGFCGMEVDGRHYTEKEDAGKAIIDVCTRMTGSDAVLLGQYRGFSMVLAYDGRSNEYRITLKGTLSHTVTLGADVFGNITRLDNALENLAGSLQAEQNSLEETKTQLENARTELATPFAREEELAEKTARLKELNILLNMDEKDKTLMDDTPDEGEDVPARRVAELAR